MENLAPDSKTDIATEPYQGPGPVVASAGYIYLSHGISAIAGFFAVGALGALFSKRTVAIKNAFEAYGTTHANSDNGFVKAVAWVAGSVPKAAEWVATKASATAKKLGSSKVMGEPATEDKATAFMFAGGLGAAAGWIGSTVWGLVKGSHEGTRGKHQFKRAQREIGSLRETNADLERINNELHEKYVEASTRFENLSAKHAQTNLSVAPDTENHRAKNNLHPAAKKEIPSSSSLSNAQHGGTISAERTAETAIS